MRAVLVGERIDTRGLERTNNTSYGPIVIRLGDGWAVVFRYGVAIFFGCAEERQKALLDTLHERTVRPLERPEEDRVTITVTTDIDEQIATDGVIVLRNTEPERLQILAQVLSKNVVLNHYETRLADLFDQIEPLADQLRRRGRAGAYAKRLLQHIGYVLMTQHRMVGRVEIEEKPEVLWDHPEVERLYARLEDEYELRERSRAVERKLDLLSETVRILLELVETSRSLRLEYYIIGLIVLEVLLSAFDQIKAML